MQRADNGELKANLIRDAFTYQVGKEIGAMASVLCGAVDAIILTGGIAHHEANGKENKVHDRVYC